MKQISLAITVLFYLITTPSAYASALSGPTCNVTAEVAYFKSVDTIYIAENGQETDGRTVYAMLKILNTKPAQFYGNCNFIKTGDVFRIDSNENKLQTGQKINAGLELTSSMSLGGVVNFINWSPVKLLTESVNLPFTMQSPDKPDFPIATPLTNADDTAIIAKANNQFTFSLYSKIKGKSGNIFISPYSITSAMAMVYEGARGQTAQQIQSVFHFPIDATIRHQSYAITNNQLNQSNNQYQLKIANALWLQTDYQLLSDYSTTIQKYYSGQATNVDFKKETEQSRQTINNWVENKTNNKIKDLISQGAVNSQTKLVLTNAIYFKGDWLKTFDKKLTRDKNFKTDTAIIKVPLMQRADSETYYNYFEDDYLQMLELPYSGDQLSMLVILPKQNNLKSWENSLTLNKFEEWKNKLTRQTVNVYLPKFTFSDKYLLKDTLTEMGMPIGFSDLADFSGLAGPALKNALKISEVIHQSFVDVNEQGTEAAAATSIVMKPTAALAPAGHVYTFRADHPFLFIIQDTKTNGNILFFGRINNPLTNMNLNTTPTQEKQSSLKPYNFLWTILLFLLGRY